MISYSEYLEHYGVKGMKWGQRKAVDRQPLSTAGAVTKTTRQVIGDHNNKKMTDKEFKKKYDISREKYAQRVAKNGDPYAARVNVTQGRAKAQGLLNVALENPNVAISLNGVTMTNGKGFVDYMARGGVLDTRMTMIMRQES